MRFELKSPLPSRRSAEALREQLIEHFIGTRPQVGQRFLSEYELARIVGLSRPTVRRAMLELHREGWIERRNGRGTFIGPRAAMPLAPRRHTVTSSRRVLRMALLVHGLGDFRHDWYSPAVLSGIDDVANDLGVSIEVLGDYDCDVKSVSQRLMQSHPDVLACNAPGARHAMLIGESQRLDIPCIGTGTFLTDLGVPTVHEDGVAGGAMAVRHLVEHGHKRIGFIQLAFSVPWVFHRHQGYLQGLRECGLDPDDRYCLWLRPGEEHGEENRAALLDYFNRFQPTAIVAGSFTPLRHLAPLIQAGKLRVPRDVSIVNFDQHPECAAWLGGVTPTVVELPLRDMGRKLAEMGRALLDGKELDKVTQLPCTLAAGNSVARV
ncbi:MAG: GntR family transcriptional regulator [Tepidisphaeraceae bacterium]